MTTSSAASPDPIPEPTQVGIRELKANLSAFVKRAAAGETIVVTDRGTPTVRLIAEPAHVESTRERGIREGWLTPREHWDLAWATRPCDAVPGIPGAPDSLVTIREGREDRF